MRHGSGRGRALLRAPRNIQDSHSGRPRRDNDLRFQRRSPGFDSRRCGSHPEDQERRRGNRMRSPFRGIAARLDRRGGGTEGNQHRGQESLLQHSCKKEIPEIRQRGIQAHSRRIHKSRDHPPRNLVQPHPQRQGCLRAEKGQGNQVQDSGPPGAQRHRRHGGCRRRDFPGESQGLCGQAGQCQKDSRQPVLLRQRQVLQKPVHAQGGDEGL